MILYKSLQMNGRMQTGLVIRNVERHPGRPASGDSGGNHAFRDMLHQRRLSSSVSAITHNARLSLISVSML